MTAGSRRFTVILVNYNSLANIATLLGSGALDGHDVTVVDNGDDPAGVTALCAERSATPLLLPDNLGFAGGVNRAVAAITAAGEPAQPWLLLNPDVEVSADQLAILDQRLGSTLTGVAPLLQSADGRLQVGAAGGRLTARSVATYFLFLSHLLPRLVGVILTRRQSQRASRVEWLCMACLALAPNAFARYGPIPETEVVYAEDLAWGTAASAIGARFEVVPDVIVGHDQGASGASDRWVGALTRLCRARLGPVRGAIANASIRAGLSARRLGGRQVQ